MNLDVPNLVKEKQLNKQKMDSETEIKDRNYHHHHYIHNILSNKQIKSTSQKRFLNSSGKMFLYLITILVLPQILMCLLSNQNQADNNNPFNRVQAVTYYNYEPIDDSLPRLIRINYNDEGLMKDKVLNMKMGDSRKLNLTIKIDKALLISKLAPIVYIPDFVGIKFEHRTIQPQFEILQLSNETLLFERKLLEKSYFEINVTMPIYADYLGRAQLQPAQLLLCNKSATILEYTNQMNSNETLIVKQLTSDTDLLRVIIIQNKGFWDTLFIVTVSLLVIIIYLNLGAQIDLGNMRQIIHRPRSIFLGFLISTLTMPLVAFLIPQLFETRNFLLYRVGFFMFACGPAALASTPWTELMGGDKELSMSLQLISTVAGFFVMPTLVFLMELAIGQGDYELLKDHPLQVPYSRLIELLIILIVSLSIGYYFIGKNPKLRKLTGRIYRPLIFAMLLFIIISSSVIYWHIYRMFDWSITLTAACIIATTIVLSYLLALTSTCDRKHALTIAISSIYKNEGIAFTILAFAFDKPDNFVAYVPCLTQILITSLSFCLIRTCIQFGKLCRTRANDNNNNIEATSSKTPELIVTTSASQQQTSDASCCATKREREEFIPVNVTDGQLDADADADEANSEQSELKVKLGVAGESDKQDDKPVC